MQQNLRRLVVAMPLVMLGLTGALLAFQAPAPAPSLPQPLAPEEEQRFASAWAQQPVVDLGVPKGTAKIVIVKFNDWLCVACKGWHELYQPLFDKYEKESPGSIKYLTKDFPWNSRCNFRASTLAGHEGSCEAAAAVRLARDRGKERDMVTWLFAEQAKLNNMRLQGPNAAGDAIKAKAVSLLALKPGEFERDYATRVLAIRQDVSDGVALNVDSTPVYYVNGIRTTQPLAQDGSGGNLPPVYFDAALRLELKKNTK